MNPPEPGAQEYEGGPFLSYNENKPNFKQHLMSQPYTAWNLAPVNGIAIDFRGFGWSNAGVAGNWHRLMGEWGLKDLKLAVINGLGSDSHLLDDNTVQLSAAMMMDMDGGEMGKLAGIAQEDEGDICDMGDDDGMSGMDDGEMGGMQADGPVFPTVRPRDVLIQNETNNDLRDNNKATVVKATFKSIAHPVDLQTADVSGWH